MKILTKRVLAAAVWLGFATTTFAQAPGADHLSVPFSDSTRSGTVRVNLLSGSISVKGYGGKEVIVDAKPREHDDQLPGRDRSSRPDTAGLKRIPDLSTGLTVEEENNVVSITSRRIGRSIDISIQVPSRTSLRLSTVNDGDIKVDQVQGEIEVNDVNGGVTLTQVSGSVVAHALNGNVKVSMAAVELNKPMSFSSLNGDIDVALPPDIKATVSMKSDNGEVFSDFDIKIDPSAVQSATQDSSGKRGRYRISMDRTTKGTINGGGSELQFKTFNGNIYIRKASK